MPGGTRKESEWCIEKDRLTYTYSNDPCFDNCQMRGKNGIPRHADTGYSAEFGQK
jgi:hypothetical protein